MTVAPPQRAPRRVTKATAVLLATLLACIAITTAAAAGSLSVSGQLHERPMGLGSASPGLSAQAQGASPEDTAGYFTLGQGRKLFYYFFQARSRAGAVMMMHL